MTVNETVSYPSGRNAEGSMGEKWKFRRLSVKTQVMIGAMIVPILSSFILLVIFYKNIRGFYVERVQDMQQHTIDITAGNLEDFVKQCETVSEQVLGMVVFQDDLEGYAQKTAYERLLISRNINAGLLNIKLANRVVDHIYLLSFDGQGFSTNSEWNKNSFVEGLPEALDADQAGRKMVIPSRKVEYANINHSRYAPLKISYLMYLNRYTKSGMIGLVQMDVNYSQIENIMKNMALGEGDFSFIIDEKQNLIYAPEKELAGMYAGDVSYNGLCLELFCGKENGEMEDSYTVRTREIGGSKWKLVQVSSDALLNQELKRAMRNWIVALAAYIACATAVSVSIARGITAPIMKMIGSMKDAGRGNFKVQVSGSYNKELAYLAESFEQMVSQIDGLMKENIQKEHEKTALQMQALNAKINSHFLYNTLNGIKWQAIKAKQLPIAESIVALTKILEYSYKDTDSMVSLREELSFINDYVYVQNMRYDSHVQIQYDIEEGTENCMILKMLLQPVVENALMYAFDGESLDNIVRIGCRRQQGNLVITVRDNGKGFIFQGMDKLTGIGLNNILQRMKLNFEEECGMEISSKDGEGTCVVMIVPEIYYEDKINVDADCGR